MESAEILVLQASYTNPVHAEAIGLVLNHYAEDPMGGGHPLPADRLQQLPGELAKRPHAFSVLAFVGGEPAGLVNCFEGFFRPSPAGRWSTCTMWQWCRSFAGWG